MLDPDIHAHLLAAAGAHPSLRAALVQAGPIRHRAAGAPARRRPPVRRGGQPAALHPGRRGDLGADRGRRRGGGLEPPRPVRGRRRGRGCGPAASRATRSARSRRSSRPRRRACSAPTSPGCRTPSARRSCAASAASAPGRPTWSASFTSTIPTSGRRATWRRWAACAGSPARPIRAPWRPPSRRTARSWPAPSGASRTRPPCRHPLDALRRPRGGRGAAKSG